MNGPIAMIHQMSKMPATPVLIPVLQRLGVKTVTIELLIGRTKLNQAGGNDKELLMFYDALEAAGIARSGWGYTLFDQPGAQGDDMMERVEKLNLTSFILNPEKEWVNVIGGPKAAKLMMDKFKVRNFEVGFCSYRYPTWHPMPYLAFLNHEAMDFIAPQVYWIDSHDPGAQLERTVVEYRELSDLPIFPIAGTFPQGSWEPSVADFKEFLAKVKEMRLPGYGFFDLDALLTRKDWMDVFAGEPTTPPPPPPPPAPAEGLKFRVSAIKGLNKRSAPVQANNIIGAWPYGAEISPVDVGGDVGAWVKDRDTGAWGCVQLAGVRYMEVVDAG